MACELFITGASGYLGGELARHASAAGSYFEHEPPPGLDRAVRLDIREAGAVAAVFAELLPSAVIHTAYRQSGDGAEEVNVAGSRNLARAAAVAGARLVHVSTDLVFDGALGRPYTEEDEPRPAIEYGRQKLDAEHAVREEAPDALIVRTALIYGGAVPGPQEKLAQREDVSFFTDELRSPVQVGDLAAALLELAGSPATGVLHVAGADGLSRHDFARLLVGDARPLGSGLAAEHPEPRALDCRLDSSRAQALLSTRLRGAREVLGA